MNDHQKFPKNWIFNKEFDFFWKNYSSLWNSANNNYLTNYNKLTNASINATIEAKRAALTKTKQNFHQEKKENDDENIEFEISDELVKFYEESLKFQNQKSLKIFIS
jgi:hypothetical protein